METQSQTQNQELLEFFKTLASAERLKVAGLLALERISMAEIARRIPMPITEVFKHLGHLQRLGLVRSEAAEGEITADMPLSLDTAALEAMTKRILAGMRPRFAAEAQSGDEFERKVLRDYLTADGALKSIPSQEKKLLVVLRHLAQAFAEDQRYSEKQVNEILKRFNPDTAALRRSLVDYRLLAREQGEYWKP